MTNNKEQYLAALKQQNYWRLFIDGSRQGSDYLSENSMEGFEEYHLGPLLWMLREPHGLAKLKTAATELYSKDLDKELTFEFLEKINKSAYPFEDHLRLANNYTFSTLELTHKKK